MKKKVALAVVMALIAVGAFAAQTFYYNSGKYFSAPGPTVIKTNKAGVDHIYISNVLGTAQFINVYNATSAAGESASSLVMSISVTAATVNMDVPVRALFSQGIVIDCGTATGTGSVFCVDSN